MEMIPVKSSLIVAVGHDPASSKLRVKFNSGGLYEYHNVPAATHERLIKSASIGKAFGEFIKGAHAFSKV